MVVFRGDLKTRDVETLLPNVRQEYGRVRLRTWLIAILGFLVLSLLFVNSFDTGQLRISHYVNATALRSNISKEHTPPMSPRISGYLVNNEGCRIAAFDPFDAVSRRYMRTEKPIRCNGDDRAPLIESNDTAVYVNPLAHNQYYNESETPDCCWTSFTRKAGQDNAVTYAETCYRFQESASVRIAEFVKVECFRDGKRVYQDYHAFVPRKEATEKRCREARKKLGSAERPLSLMMIGLDAVSRLNFHRMMPKTIETLKRLEAIELLGYNKVGDNTYPNLVPVLTGLSMTELETKCLKNNTRTPFDDCPFIWKNYSDRGYRTIFAEDACSITTFNYLKAGFRDSPTDYYRRPYCIAAENNIGNRHEGNANLCLGGRKNFASLLDYALKAATQFVDDPYFAFIWQASLTHDYFNYPQMGDGDYSDFFLRLEKRGMLENTALVVLSDHGLRWGNYRQTYQGRMEGSLPFVFVVLPAHWRQRYTVAVANLRRNARSLTTPYDLYETLVDLLEMSDDRSETEAMRDSRDQGDTIERGISLFDSIPSYRTCPMAAIPEHWCMCHDSSNVSVNDTGVQIAAQYLINELNKLLASYRQCSPLRLERLVDAKMWIKREVEKSDERNKRESTPPWIDYTITVETVPGNAIFEASIRHNGTSDKLVGSVGRLNAYGTQSSCVDDFNMRLYCYCY